MRLGIEYEVAQYYECVCNDDQEKEYDHHQKGANVTYREDHYLIPKDIDGHESPRSSELIKQVE